MRDGVIVQVAKIIQHPNYVEDKSDYDFALLKLKEPLEFFDEIQPVELPDQDEPVEEYTKCIVTGWGRTSEEGIMANKLRAAIVFTWNEEKCAKAYEDTSPITDRMFCAHDSNKDACKGDSGGPLVSVYDQKLIGET